MSELTPITRKEHIMSGVDITPITREEMFLQKIVEGGGGGGSSLPSYTSSDVGKVLTLETSTETITIAEEQTFTVANGYGQMTVDFAPLSVGDHAQVNGTVSGQAISIDMVVVEYEGKLYLIDAFYSEYDPTRGYVSEDGVFYYPAMAQVPSVELSGSITAAKTTDPAPKWGTVSHPLAYYPDVNHKLDGITVREAYDLLQSGNIIFTVDTQLHSIKILTKIDRNSTEPYAYSVYWNFNSTAVGSNLSDDDLVPTTSFD